MTNATRRLRVTGDPYLDTRGMEMLERGIVRAAMRTTLPREGFSALRDRVQSNEFCDSERTLFVVNYDQRQTKADKACLGFEVLAKEIVLLNKDVRMLDLYRLTFAREHMFDPEQRRILESEYVFIRDFFLEKNHGLPFDPERMYEIEAYLFDRQMMERKTFLFIHGMALNSQKLEDWWSHSLISYLRELAEPVLLETQ